MADPTPNETPKTPDAPKDVIKDMPRPISIFRDESAKTGVVLQGAAAERQAVDEKFNKASSAYAPALANYDKELKAAAGERLAIRKESVDALTREAGTTENAVAQLQKQLEEARSKLWRTQDELRAAKNDLGNEVGKIATEQKTARKIKITALSAEVKAARKERNAVYKKTGKELRREHWNTFARTTKETVAYVPDMTFRFGKAAVRAVGEAFSVFGRSAKKAQEGFVEPTPFSITREKPLGAQAPKKPQAPAA